MASVKRCKDCGEEKPVSEFYPAATTKDFLQIYCKSCQNARSKKWQKDNPEKFRTHLKASQQKRKVLLDKVKELEKSGVPWMEAVEKVKNDNSRVVVVESKEEEEDWGGMEPVYERE